ncbi:YlxM family DNA-binding protein [Amedibacillus sp. YH-ame10]
MIDEMQRMNALLDAYEVLLTEKQQSIMDLYFKEDFSLSEIAEELHITRSAVNDHIKRSSHILEDYEKKLNLVSHYEKRKEIYGKIKEVGNEEVKLLMDALENME